MGGPVARPGQDRARLLTALPDTSHPGHPPPAACELGERTPRASPLRPLPPGAVWLPHILFTSKQHLLASFPFPHFLSPKHFKQKPEDITAPRVSCVNTRKVFSQRKSSLTRDIWSQEAVLGSDMLTAALPRARCMVDRINSISFFFFTLRELIF